MNSSYKNVFSVPIWRVNLFYTFTKFCFNVRLFMPSSEKKFSFICENGVKFVFMGVKKNHSTLNTLNTNYACYTTSKIKIFEKKI